MIISNYSYVPDNIAFLKISPDKIKILKISPFLSRLQKCSYSWWHKAAWFPERTCSLKINRQYLMCERKAALHLQLSSKKKTLVLFFFFWSIHLSGKLCGVSGFLQWTHASDDTGREHSFNLRSDNFTWKITFLYISNICLFLVTAGAEYNSRQWPLVAFCGVALDTPISILSLPAVIALLSGRTVDKLGTTRGIFLLIKQLPFCGQMIWKISK